MKKSYRWDGERFVEVEPRERVGYAERSAAEVEDDRRKKEKEERDAHPGNYV